MTSLLPVLLLVPASIVLMCAGAIVVAVLYAVGHVVADLARYAVTLAPRSSQRFPAGSRHNTVRFPLSSIGVKR
jgi:hypothetical protein